MADLSEISKPKTIRNQQLEVESTAINKWVERWYQSPQTLIVYLTALTKPLDRKPHPMFQYKREQQSEVGHSQPTEAKSTYSWSTISTLYRFITGHTFVGAFTQCFFPQHIPNQIACPCREQVQTIEHVLRDCPQYNAVCCKHLTANGHPWNTLQMFTHLKYIQSLLWFLEETGVCVKLWTMWDPG